MESQAASVINVKQLIEKYEYFLFDCDGVLWHHMEHIGQAFRNIEAIEAAGKSVFFVTNMASLSRKSMAAKMASDAFKYGSAKLTHLYPASTLAGTYVLQNMPESKKVWCVGMAEMKEELESLGLECKGLGPAFDDIRFDEPGKFIKLPDLDEWELDPEIKAVICGSDREFNWSKLSVASLYLQNGCKFIVTNEDSIGRTSKGFRSPGNGVIVKAISETLKKTGKPDELICEKVVTGKPNPAIVDIIRKDHNIPESELPKFVMIGDNPPTDIALGNNAGIDTCLVLTGVVQTMEEMDEYIAQDPKLFKPTVILPSFGDEL